MEGSDGDASWTTDIHCSLRGSEGREYIGQRMLQHLNICGFVGKSLDKAEKDADVADDGLREMSR